MNKKQNNKMEGKLEGASLQEMGGWICLTGVYGKTSREKYSVGIREKLRCKAG